MIVAAGPTFDSEDQATFMFAIGLHKWHKCSHSFFKHSPKTKHMYIWSGYVHHQPLKLKTTATNPQPSNNRNRHNKKYTSWYMGSKRSICRDSLKKKASVIGNTDMGRQSLKIHSKIYVLMAYIHLSEVTTVNILYIHQKTITNHWHISHKVSKTSHNIYHFGICYSWCQEAMIYHITWYFYNGAPFTRPWNWLSLQSPTLSSPTKFELNAISGLSENVRKPQKCDRWMNEWMDEQTHGRTEGGHSFVSLQLCWQARSPECSTFLIYRNKYWYLWSKAIMGGCPPRIFLQQVMTLCPSLYFGSSHSQWL